MDLNALLKAFGPMQEAVRKADAERGSATFIGSAGGGAVKVTLSGLLEVKQVAIAPAAAPGGDAGMLEDLVAAAIGDALRQYRARYGVTSEEQMQRTMAGKDIGSLLGGLG